jgi:hypothetical protein
MTLKKLIFNFIILSTPIGCALAIQSSPSKSTVCDLSKAKSENLGMIVQVSGLYGTDMHHGAYLKDPNCPEKAIRIGYFINENDPSIVKFEQDQRLRYTKLREYRRIQVTLIGKLERDGDEETQRTDHKIRFRFDVIKIISYKFLPN